jgi:hypothetical protein
MHITHNDKIRVAVSSPPSCSEFDNSEKAKYSDDSVINIL